MLYVLYILYIYHILLLIFIRILLPNHCSAQLKKRLPIAEKKTATHFSKIEHPFIIVVGSICSPCL